MNVERLKDYEMQNRLVSEISDRLRLSNQKLSSADRKQKRATKIINLSNVEISIKITKLIIDENLDNLRKPFNRI